jgi:hypothetical protein
MTIPLNAFPTPKAAHRSSLSNGNRLEATSPFQVSQSEDHGAASSNTDFIHKPTAGPHQATAFCALEGIDTPLESLEACKVKARVAKPARPEAAEAAVLSRSSMTRPVPKHSISSLEVAKHSTPKDPKDPIDSNKLLCLLGSPLDILLSLGSSCATGFATLSRACRESIVRAAVALLLP